MARKTGAIESRRDRAELVRDAGYGPVSLFSLVAGLLAAFGAFAVLSGIASAIAKAANVNTDVSRNDWKQLGTTGGLIVAVVLLLSWLFGGYVAGRMARRRGLLHGLGTFIFGVVLLVVAAAIIRGLSSSKEITDNLRNVGLPTTVKEWKHFFTFAGIASLVAMVLGSAIGGILGERWHARLLGRAVDPRYGAEHDEREAASRHDGRADTRHEEATGRGAAPSPAAASRRSERDDVDLRERDREPLAAGEAGPDLSVEEERERARDRGRRT